MKYPNIHPRPSIPAHSAFAALALMLGAKVPELDHLYERTKDVLVSTVGPTSIVAQMGYEIRRMRADEGEGFLNHTTEPVHPYRNIAELTRRAAELHEGDTVKARFLERRPRDHRVEVVGLVYEDGDLLLVGGWVIATQYLNDMPQISDSLTYLRKQA